MSHRRMLVYTLSGDGVADNETRLVLPRLADVLPSTLTHLPAFTVCLWVNLLLQMPATVILSYYVNASLQNALLIRLEGGSVSVSAVLTSYMWPVRVVPKIWQLICLVQDDTTLTLVVGKQSLVHVGHGGMLPLTGTLVLGNDQDHGRDTGFSPSEAFLGDLAGLTIWGLPLPKFDLERLDRCLYPAASPLTPVALPWLALGKVKTREGDPCQESHNLIRLVIPIPFSASIGRSHCQDLGMELAVLETAEEAKEVGEVLAGPALKACMGVSRSQSLAWTGMVYNISVRQWMDMDGAPLSIIPPELSALDPKVTTHAALTSENKWALVQLLWGDICIVCKGEEGQGQYQLRGLCHHPLDLYPRRHPSGLLYWHGSGPPGLILELKGEQWLLRKWGGSVVAEHDDESPLLLGRRNWTIQDPAVCGGEALVDSGSGRQLSLGPCRADQFMCWAGQCVPAEARCSLNHDCLDGSDELGCKLVRLQAGYQRHLPPPSPVFNLAVALSLSKVSVGCSGKDLEAIRVTMRVWVRWRDGRLQYFNLHDDLGLNIVQPPTSQGIWRPSIQVEDEMRLSGPAPYLSRLMVSRDSRGKFTGFDTVYEGQANDLELQVDVTADVYCPFNLWRLPIDTQTCNISLTLSNLPMQHAVYHPNRFPRAPPLCPETNLVEFVITSCELHLTNRSSVMVASVRLQRRWSYHVWATYVPTALLHGIGYGTLTIAASDFQSRGMMSLTSLLVLIALYSDTLTALPSSSYLRLMDVWLIFSVAFLASIIAVHMAASDPRGQAAHITLLRARLVLAVGYCIFNIVYWTSLAA